MKTKKQIEKIYKEEKELLDKTDWFGSSHDYLIQQGWVEALECILEND